MAVVREKEQEFEALRHGFARRAYAHVGSVFENQSEVWRAVHRAESGVHYHALGDRRPWYESAPVWTVAQLMAVLAAAAAAAAAAAGSVGLIARD